MTDLTLTGPGSVTYHDDAPPESLGGVWRWAVVDAGMTRGARGLPPHWSMARDVILAATPYLSDFWDAALRTAVNQIIVRQFTVKDSEDSARRLERSQSMLLDFGGPAMYSESLSQVAQDFFTTDNGGWVEIEYEGRTKSGKPGGRPVALHHLDSLRVWRTGNREYPAVYVDLQGQYHRMHASSVFSLVDQPSARLGLWGVGRCAASSNWRTILLAGALEQYLLEKVSGSRALALHFVKGVNRQRLEDAAVTSDEAQAAKGQVIYKGAVIIPVLDDVDVATVDLAGIPDGFQAAELRQLIALNTALALGMPYTDIATLPGGQFGTGTQSQVIDESRKGRGVESFVRQWERKLNRLVLPRRTTVDMFGVDPRDQKLEAEVKNAEAGYVKALIEAGAATPQQAANYLADNGFWPAEFVQQDATTGGALTDSGQDSKVSGEAELSPDPLATPGVLALMKRRAEIEGRGTREAPDKGILGYHIETGVVTRNEARAALGLPPEPEADDERLRRISGKLSILKSATEAGIDLPQALALVGLTLPPAGLAQAETNAAPTAPEQQPAAPGEPPLAPLARMLALGKAQRRRVTRVTPEDLTDPQTLAAAAALSAQE